MSEHMTDPYRDLRIEQLGVELRLVRSQIRALKTELAQVTETNTGLREALLEARNHIGIRDKALDETVAERDEWEERARDLTRRIDLADNDPDPTRAYNLLAVNVTAEVKQWDS